MESGTNLGPYEIRDQIGAGGSMGEVYRATATRLGPTEKRVIRSNIDMLQT